MCVHILSYYMHTLWLICQIYHPFILLEMNIQMYTVRSTVYSNYTNIVNRQTLIWCSVCIHRYICGMLYSMLYTHKYRTVYSNMPLMYLYLRIFILSKRHCVPSIQEINFNYFIGVRKSIQDWFYLRKISQNTFIFFPQRIYGIATST